MNIVLWVIQGIAAFLFISGGATKAFKFDQLANMPANRGLSRGTWRVVGFVEMIGAVLLIVPIAIDWMPELTPYAAGVLAVECLVLSVMFARHSVKLTAANPLVWSATMGILAAIVAFGRCPFNHMN